jgi:hypothetical protein
MGTYASQTSVSSENSRAEIERTLRRYGADSFAYMSSPGGAKVAFQYRGMQVRFELKLPDPDDREFTHHSKGARTPSARENLYEQAVRQKWRALALVVKAKLEAVESGIAEFSQEFYGYLVLPSGRTVFDDTIAQVSAVIEAGSTGRLMLESGPEPG